MSEQPFRVAVPDLDIELLQKKLDLVRFPDELDDAGWKYGTPLADIRRLVAHWKNGFDWRKAEAEINEVPQLTRDVDVDGFGALNIHYVHQESKVGNAIPLLFIHGWPGHFLEVKKILPLLTAVSSDHPSFHVVALSLPGFGFSEAPKKEGFHRTQYAEVGHELMLALGYNEYVIQGGDWGYWVARTMVSQYGDQGVKAWHTNYPLASLESWTSVPLLHLPAMLMPYTAAERAELRRMDWFQQKGMGYNHEQSTVPQTLGYSLADSPIGLLAWIYEKLVIWSDGYPWADDEVLTWVSIYWFSRAGPAASVRIYYEFAKAGDYQNFLWRRVPLGLSFFPKDITGPRRWSHAIGNVVFESEHEKGGHFAAIERPEDLASDLRRMFAKGGPAYGVVPGKSGHLP